MANILEGHVAQRLAQLSKERGDEGGGNLEANALVPYVMALLKKHVQERDAHLNYCVEELEDFLQQDSRPFVEEIFGFLDNSPEAQSVLAQPYMPKRVRSEAAAEQTTAKRRRADPPEAAPAPAPAEAAGRFARGDSERPEGRAASPAAAPADPPVVDEATLNSVMPQLEQLLREAEQQQQQQQPPPPSPPAQTPPPQGSGGGLAGLESLITPDLLGGLTLSQLGLALGIQPPSGVQMPPPQPAPQPNALAGLAGLLRPQSSPAPSAGGLGSTADLAMSLLGGSQGLLGGIPGLGPAGAMQQQQQQFGGFGLGGQADLAALARERERSRVRDAQLRSMQCILVVCKVPPYQNHESAMRGHFSRFGEVRSVVCNPLTGKAYVVFNNMRSLRQALDCPAAVLGSRFISLYQCTERDLEELVNSPLPGGKGKGSAPPRAPASPAAPSAAAERQSRAQKELNELKAQLVARAKAAEAKCAAELQAKEQQAEIIRQEVAALQGQVAQPALALATKAAIQEKVQESSERLKAAEEECAALQTKIEHYRKTQQENTVAAPTAASTPKLRGPQQGGQKPWWAQKRSNVLDARTKVLRVDGLGQEALASKELKNDFRIFGEPVDLTISGTTVEVEFRERWQAEKCMKALMNRKTPAGGEPLAVEWVER
eukprot:TRINITY_DN7559_c0_g1_i1.p1 TRINITY_DN7559_c0_g1~~TRINITY_DN7559_c0_g1_i1.p1  ORF type:complete len:688 (+),score=217.15 TRINITY_DN7559_c0_g1_i1:90-2066(+)